MIAYSNYYRELFIGQATTSSNTVVSVKVRRRMVLGSLRTTPFNWMQAPQEGISYEFNSRISQTRKRYMKSSLRIWASF